LRFIARIAGQNQYNKLLGNVRITVRSFRIVITCMVKYLKLEDIIISSSLLYPVLNPMRTIPYFPGTFLGGKKKKKKNNC
jgi:hypothetical protein